MRDTSRSRYAAAVLAWTVIAGCGATQPRSVAAPATVEGCEILQVEATTTLRAPIVVPDGGVVCRHGSVMDINGSFVELQQSTLRGPDCIITYSVGSSTYVINAQQNLCEFEAGQVTAKVISGNATVTTTNGSLSEIRPGLVTVTLN